MIICDLMMPVMSGMDFYAEVRRSRPDLAERTIFMTGGCFTSQMKSFFQVVENPRIEKPFDLPRIRSMIQDLLEPAVRPAGGIP